MGRIFTIGESLLDIIFEGDHPVGAKAGGAMLNTSVSLGRLSLPVYLITEFANDRVGHIIDGFLRSNGVSADYVYKYDAGKTAIAMAFLDDHRNADYVFFKQYPAERLLIQPVEFCSTDILLFGSFFSVSAAVRDRLWSVILAARACGATIIYDPNFRKSHLHDLPVAMPMILENIAAADLVRASDEDLQFVFGTRDADQGYDCVKAAGCDVLIYTESDKQVCVRTPSDAFNLPVPKIEPISTIGAGDNFNAGIINELYRFGRKPHELNRLQWYEMALAGMAFGSHVCTLLENYITNAFAAERNQRPIDGLS